MGVLLTLMSALLYFTDTNECSAILYYTNGCSTDEWSYYGTRECCTILIGVFYYTALILMSALLNLVSR